MQGQPNKLRGLKEDLKWDILKLTTIKLEIFLSIIRSYNIKLNNTNINMKYTHEIISLIIVSQLVVKLISKVYTTWPKIININKIILLIQLIV
jgi:hypothetical protein